MKTKITKASSPRQHFSQPFEESAAESAAAVRKKNIQFNNNIFNEHFGNYYYYYFIPLVIGTERRISAWRVAKALCNKQSN